MKPCKCGSHAINPLRHGRDEKDLDFCDVCYWRKRAEEKIERDKQVDAVIADYAKSDLNCPHCGGSGHADDVQSPALPPIENEPVAYVRHGEFVPAERMYLVSDRSAWTPLYTHAAPSAGVQIDERAEFEKWFHPTKQERIGDCYANGEAQDAWEGWQARAEIRSAKTTDEHGQLEYAHDAGVSDARFGIHELFVNEEIDMPGLEGDRPFCRFVWFYDSGDQSAGESARGYWSLAENQSGTELHDLLVRSFPSDNLDAVATIIEFSRSNNWLAELCILESYKADIGLVEKYWAPSVMTSMLFAEGIKYGQKRTAIAAQKAGVK